MRDLTIEIRWTLTLFGLDFNAWRTRQIRTAEMCHVHSFSASNIIYNNCFSLFFMKRALKVLQRDERERQEDDLLRAQLAREEATELAHEKKRKIEEKFATKWKEHLEKWDEFGLQIASDREITLPVPDPPGHCNLLICRNKGNFRCFIGFGSIRTQTERTGLSECADP